MTKRALLLGAGFSHDLGMPLAAGFTKDFFYFLNPDRMEKYIIRIWKTADPYGADRPIDPKTMDEVLGIYKQFYDSSDGNYESFLKTIQDRYHELGAKQDRRDTLHYVFGKFLDMIVQMFYMYQVNNLWIYMANKKFYKSLFHFLSDDELWVLSLNHDLFIEFLCFDYKIPLSFGAKEYMKLPKSNRDLQSTVSFCKTPRRDMKLDAMNFIRGLAGVNLIKLHGAINEFSYNDDKEILHVGYDENETSISYLQKVSLVLHEMSYFVGNTPANICTEIAVSDFDGQMQFLRQSILTGGYKYSETFDPKPGEEKIGLMEEVLDTVDELVVIGYGFNDDHVNKRIYNAMLINKSLSAIVVDPYMKKMPDVLKPFDYKSRVRGARCAMPEWVHYMETGNWNMDCKEQLQMMRASRSIFDDEYRKRFLSPKV